MSKTKYGHYEGTSTTPYLVRTEITYTQEELNTSVKEEREELEKVFTLIRKWAKTWAPENQVLTCEERLKTIYALTLTTLRARGDE